MSTDQPPAPATLQDVAEFRLTDMEDWLVSLIRQETLNNPVSDFHLRHLIAKKDCIQKAIYERRQLREQLESAIAEKERLARALEADIIWFEDCATYFTGLHNVKLKARAETIKDLLACLKATPPQESGKP